MNRPAHVSVIVPCFNQASFLPDAIESLLGQTHEDWSALVVDDGSTDETPAVAARLAQGDPRVTTVRLAHRGLAAARNAGLDLASGAYIQFLDADDWLHPDKLSAQVALLRTQPGPALAYCDYGFTDRDRRVVAPPDPRLTTPRFLHRRPVLDIARRWESDLSIPVHCFLFEASLFRRHGVRFDTSLSSHEDWDCWMQVFRMEPAIAYVPRPLAFYRLHAASISRDPRRMWDGYRRALMKHIERCGDDAELRDALGAKLEATAGAYWDEVNGAGWRDWVRRGLRLGGDRVPWPVQRAVRRLLMR